MPLEVQAFFQGFNFDTLLAIISCITGIVALFIGGAAYKQCQINKNSFNDKKEFEDQSQDHSQKAGRDIINNCDTTALANLTAASFETSLKLAYAQFEQKTTDNLHQIINETRRIIEENSIQLGAYTKIDWINVYFENAKNASDTYMQNIWAKVLAKELSAPGSFSFKTLDIIKNLSAEDFQLFEKFVSLSFNDCIFKNREFKKYFSWSKCLKMKEFGLINLDGTEQTITVAPKNSSKILIGNNKFSIFFNNESDQSQDVKYDIYTLSSSAKEMRCLAISTDQREYFVEVAKELRTKYEGKLNITLHKVNWVEGTSFNYDEPDLIAEK